MKGFIFLGWLVLISGGEAEPEEDGVDERMMSVSEVDFGMLSGGGRGGCFLGGRARGADIWDKPGEAGEEEVQEKG